MTPADARQHALIAKLSAEARAGSSRSADDRLSDISVRIGTLVGVICLLLLAGLFGILFSVRAAWLGALAVPAGFCVVRIARLSGGYRQAFIDAEMARGLSELDAIKLYVQRGNENTG